MLSIRWRYKWILVALVVVPFAGGVELAGSAQPVAARAEIAQTETADGGVSDAGARAAVHAEILNSGLPPLGYYRQQSVSELFNLHLQEDHTFELRHTDCCTGFLVKGTWSIANGAYVLDHHPVSHGNKKHTSRSNVTLLRKDEKGRIIETRDGRIVAKWFSGTSCMQCELSGAYVCPNSYFGREGRGGPYLKSILKP